VVEREHILLTRPFYELSGGLAGQPLHEARVLNVAGAIVPVHIYLPRVDLSMVPSPKGSGPAFSARLNQHSFGRMLLRKPRAAFNNLPAGGNNLILYLLEGLNSAVNILKKNLQRALRRAPAGVVVRPGMLMIVEVKAATEAGRSIASGLLEAAVDAARPPLILNKLEGDATLLYAFAENDRVILANSLVNQAKRMFSAFMFKRGQALSANPQIGKELRTIRFRAIFHAGDVAFKHIREFDELAGLGVILAHRLLQRSGATESALWMTDSFYDLVAGKNVPVTPATVMAMDELGDVPVRMLAL
jgi:hypothetical protein